MWMVSVFINVYICILQWEETSTDSDVGRRLKGVREGTRMGLLLTRDGQLHLYVDGHNQGTIQTGLSLTQHAAFRLCGSFVNQVR